MRYIINILIAIDQFANTILGGDPDMTISTRMGNWLRSGGYIKQAIAVVICRLLNIVDKNHCEDAKE